MKSWRLTLSFALFTAACVCAAVPKVLIVQSTGTTAADNVQLADSLAQAIEEDGRLDPIVWSVTDPYFRAAVLDGRVKQAPEKPSLEQVQDAAKALACEYVINLKVLLKETALTGNIQLLKGGSVVWKDDQTMDPGRASVNDLDNAVRSVARTWIFKMGAGPLRSLAVVPKPPEAPVVAPGKTPDVVLPTQTEIAPDSSKVLAEYQRLYSAKQVAKATNLLREAIDSMPLDAKLRVAFVQHLNSIGRHDEAAAEAQRALVLLPESPELRALAARTYINSGQSDLAEAQLNEALARNPDDPLTRTMVADLNLRALKPRAAIEHIDAAFKKTPTKDLAYRRATANALLGNGAAVEADLAQAAKLESTSEIETYRLCMHVVDNGLDKRMGDLRSLFQRATVKRQDPEVAQLLDSQISLLQTHQKLLQGWPAPGIHKNSHGKRLLALNLLAQSLSGLKAFLSDGNEDTLSDSSIDLGETIKQFGLAKQALSMEEGSIAEHGSITVHPDY